MPHPYEQLPPRSFWKSAVGARPMHEIGELWSPKFSISKDEPIATLGSCFAQHISRALMENGYTWFNAEPAPPRFPEALKAKFNYDVFSARVGNVYTVALLRQWVRWAFGVCSPSAEVWHDRERFYDPFRPNIEPGGFTSEEELLATRAQTLRALRSMFETTRVFVFTLGLTEAWVNRDDGSIYPTCPGTLAGQFAPELHQFKNYTYPEIYSDLSDVVRTIKEVNPNIKIILTVSPVPLVATASSNHVLLATIHSKSTLRAIAGDAAVQMNGIEYFPSYEIISSFPFRGAFYEPNLRNVSNEGVAFVMRTFFASVGAPSRDVPVESQIPAGMQGLERSRMPAPMSDPAESGEPIDLVCEEMILEEMRA